MEAKSFIADLTIIASYLIGFHEQGRWDWTERLMKHIHDGNLVPNVLKWKANMEALMKNPPTNRKDYTPIPIQRRFWGDHEFTRFCWPSNGH